MNRLKTALAIFLLLIVSSSIQAQDEVLVQDYSQVLNIPTVKAIEASETHLYILSDQDGMAVFRIKPNELQWLYTSTGMQKRGYNLSADVRFAYLSGDTKRLTILEPTSVLGVYSATLLPSKPMAAVRLQNKLYIALGDNGLGALSLETPETVDSEITYVQDVGQNVAVIDVVASPKSNQLFVLTGNSKLDVFSLSENELKFSSSLNISQRLTNLFIDGEKFWGATDQGEVFEITANGLGRKIGSVNEKVETIHFWKSYTFVRTVSGKLWYSQNRSPLIAWKTDTQAGNYIAKSGENLWLVENNKVTKIGVSSIAQNIQTAPTGPFSIKEIPNQILTYPNALLLGLEIENGHSANDVEFSIRSRTDNAVMKKQGFYWQPSPGQIGVNWFTIVGTNSKGETDSTSFTVDLRSFNTPPRFSPVRVSNIAVNEEFNLQIKAIDPEDPSTSLIRYLGVDLPEGANINEETGLFSWTPSSRQVGDFTFRVIASDQLGAASSQDITLTVLDISRGDGN
ncbi:MAG: Ig domain-containing protein [Balneola sp.]